jgi:hypothetical protein
MGGASGCDSVVGGAFAVGGALTVRSPDIVEVSSLVTIDGVIIGGAFGGAFSCALGTTSMNTMLGGALVGKLEVAAVSTGVADGCVFPLNVSPSKSITGESVGNPPSGIGGGGGASSSSIVLLGTWVLGLGGGGGTGLLLTLASLDTVVLAGIGGGGGCTGRDDVVVACGSNTLKGVGALGYDCSNGVVIGGGGALEGVLQAS